MTNQQKKLTATQRIEGLEAALSGANQNVQFLAQEIDKMRQMITSLARRVNATIKAGENGSVSNEAVQNLLVEENVQELKGKVDFLLDQEVLKPTSKKKLHDRSFVVGRELDEEKNVINPRMQFAIASLNKEVKEKLKDKKVGDFVENFSGDGLSLEITELYDIAEEKKQSKKFEEEAEVKE
jgi:hypothetical protein